MTIHVLGTRGFPDIQGGVETHCAELYTRISTFKGIKIRVYRRSGYVNNKGSSIEFENIEFVDVWTPKNKYLETFFHTFLCTLMSLTKRPDLVHFHNIGPGLFIPLVRLFGIRTVFTYHSQNYLHKKWNFFSRAVLVLGELMSLKFSSQVIFISTEMQKLMTKKYKIRNSIYITNGVNINARSTSTSYIDSINVRSLKYILAVGRITEEKGFDLLIRAFSNLKEGYKLVIAGNADMNSRYSKDVMDSSKNNNVILPGFIKGEPLMELYSNAALFAFPSYHEGLPIALLEAMSYNLNILASDITANLEIGLDKDSYFESGNEEDLKNKLEKKLSNETPLKSVNYETILKSKYNWDKSAIETYDAYWNLLHS
jgi:starch synthase